MVIAALWAGGTVVTTSSLRPSRWIQLIEEYNVDHIYALPTKLRLLVRHCKSNLSSIKYINVSDNEVEKYVVRKGDILFNRTNSKELVGKTCVFKEDIDMIIAGYIIRVRVNEKVNAEYLSAVLNSKYGKNTLFDMCKAIVGQANINAQELQNIKIIIPPIELQNQFAEFVEQVEKQKVVN